MSKIVPDVSARPKIAIGRKKKRPVTLEEILLPMDDVQETQRTWSTGPGNCWESFLAKKNNKQKKGCTVW